MTAIIHRNPDLNDSRNEIPSPPPLVYSLSLGKDNSVSRFPNFNMTWLQLPPLSRPFEA